MIRSIFLVVFIFQTIFSSAQMQTKPPYQYDKSKLLTTSSGLQYIIVEEGKGESPKKRDKIKANYHGMLLDGTVFDSSFDRGQPFETPIGVGRVIKGWDEAFLMFKPGTKAVLIIPPELGYGSRGSGRIPPNSTLEFHVELISFTKAPPPHQPFKYDPSKVVTTESGLKYAIIKEGTGKTPTKGSTIIANYHGMLENGNVFDSSFNRGQPFSTQIGVGRLIKAWDEGFLYFKEGTQAVLIVPPHLGYGAEGSGDRIPPNSTLIFDVELISVK